MQKRQTKTLTLTRLSESITACLSWVWAPSFAVPIAPVYGIWQMHPAFVFDAELAQ